MLCLVRHLFVISNSVVDWLERFVSVMTYDLLLPTAVIVTVCIVNVLTLNSLCVAFEQL